MSRPRGSRAKTRELLEQVDGVLDTYEAELPLTARQIFYRLVGAHGYAKDENAYARLQELLAKARRAGIIDFDATVLAPLEFASREEIIQRAEELAAEGQGIRLEGQPNWVELWCEAAGMAPQLARAVGEYGVTVYSSGRFDSLTVKYEASQRIGARDVPTVVLHVGDLDPSGLALHQAALEDVGAFVGTDTVRFERAAVTPEQVERYDLPTAPAKKTDKRGIWRAGDGTVQAEALPPDRLAAEVRQAVERELDLDALERAKSTESANRDEFDQIMRQLRREE